MSAGYLYGAGGGTSYLFNRPTYQNGIVNTPGRSVPDVAMDADPTTGFLEGITQTFPDGVYYDEYRIGGTSLASPLFALALQKAGGPAGLLNPTIYGQYGKASFTDVRPNSTIDAGNVRPDYVNSVDPTGGITYTVRTFGQDASLAVKKGYDQATGIGSPNQGWFSVLSNANAG